MFNVNDGVAHINGANGKYDSKVSDLSVKYGRNAAENFYSYVENPIHNDNVGLPPILDFGLSPNATESNIKKLENFTNKNNVYLDSLPPLEFEYRYMPNLHDGRIDQKALIGAAYEEMGQHKSVDVEVMDKAISVDATSTSKPLDINNDGKIDVAEYSASILASDMFSKSDKPDFGNVDGRINNQGLNIVQQYANKSNIEAAKNLYSNIYKHYDLGKYKDVGLQ